MESKETLPPSGAHLIPEAQETTPLLAITENNVVADRKPAVTTLFEDDVDSGTLWVILIPEAVTDKEFPMYGTLKTVPGKKLFVSFKSRASFLVDDPESHRQAIENAVAPIKQTLDSYPVERVICWGYSRGAYFAILLGQLLKFDRIIAVSPELLLAAPNSKSAKFIKNPHPQYENLLPYIEGFSGDHMDIIMPCFSSAEGLNVEMASTIKNPRCSVHYFPGAHFIQRRLEKSAFMADIVEKVYLGQQFELPKKWQASMLERRISKASYDLLCSMATKEYEIPAINDSSSINYEWFILKSKAFFELEDYFAAIEMAERSLELNARVAANWDHLAKIYIKIGELKKAKKANARALELKESRPAVV